MGLDVSMYNMYVFKKMYYQPINVPTAGAQAFLMD
jgi:hypothetical protein